MSPNPPREPPATLTAIGQLASHIRLVTRGQGSRDDGDPPTPDNGEGDEDGWETIGTFVIEFQRARDLHPTAHRSLAHHMESAETSQWLGIVTGPLLSWMLGRLVRGHGADASGDGSLD